MTTEERLITAIENIGVISERLGELSNLINTVHLGLIEEEMEKQVLDCIMCIFHSVNELHGLAEQTITAIKSY